MATNRSGSRPASLGPRPTRSWHTTSAPSSSGPAPVCRPAPRAPHQGAPVPARPYWPMPPVSERYIRGALLPANWARSDSWIFLRGETHPRNFNDPPGRCGLGHERRRSSQFRKQRTRGASPAKNAFFGANSLFQWFRAVSATASTARRVISSNLDARTSAGLTIQVPPHARTLGSAR